jgi:histidyl-tRNA synthetase
MMERLIEAMNVCDIDLDRITLNLGMGRGLQYYTGMIFEIYHDTISTETQVCGGGRYDDLIQALGGHRPVSACGFSYGLERLRLALNWSAEAPTTQVLVIAVADSDREEAIRVTATLRSLGLRVESDVRGRSVKGNLKYADRSGIPYCAIVGSRERESGHVVVRDMCRKQESAVPYDELAAFAEEVEGCTTS